MCGMPSTVRERKEGYIRSSRTPSRPFGNRLWRRMGLFVALVLCVVHVSGGLTGESGSLSVAGLSPDRVQARQLDGTSVTVMTFNLGNGLVDPADLLPYLRESDASLVALLEVTSEISGALETDLADIFPYREIRGDGIPGKALLSRYPITSARWLELNPGRPDLLASVDIAGHPVDVMVAHPPPPEVDGIVVQARDGTVEQFDQIIDIAASAEHPFLLLGDLNITGVHERYRELEAIGLTDVFGAVGSGSGATFPIRVPQLPDVTFQPVLRIDYIWASEEWRAETAVVGDDLGSDHLPVVAQLTLLSAAVAGLS